MDQKLKKQEYNRKYREKMKQKDTESVLESENTDDTVVVNHDVVNPPFNEIFNQQLSKSLVEEEEEKEEELEEEEEEVTRYTAEDLEEYIQRRINDAMETRSNTVVTPRDLSLKPKTDAVPSFFFQIMRNVGVSMMSTISNVAVVALVGGLVGMVSKMSQAHSNSSKSTTSTQEPSTQQQSTPPKTWQPAPYDQSMGQCANLF